MNRQLFTRPAVIVALSASIAVGLATLGLVLAGGLAGSSPAAATLTVTASGSASGAPDTCTLVMSVQSNAASATAALARNNREMTALQASLLTAGIARSDLQTSGLSISPNYDPNGHPSGYQVDDQLTVVSHRIGRVGGLIDQAAAIVGNDIQISQINFSVSNSSSLLRRARVAAVRAARSQAEQVASGAGEHLTGVVRITDDEQQTTTTLPESFAQSAAGRVALPVQGGTEQLSVQVQVVYGIGD